jgi:hypothetical protein
MDGAAQPACIATSIAIGTSLLAGLIGVWAALRSGSGALKQNPAAAILFAVAAALVLLLLAAAACIAVAGLAGVASLRIALGLTAAFAVAGMVAGGTRSLRGGTASGAHPT